MQLVFTDLAHCARQVQPSVPIGMPSRHCPACGKENQLPTSWLELHCPCKAPLPSPWPLSRPTRAP